MIAAVLLAAGASRRFDSGGSKLTQSMAGAPVIRWSADALCDARVQDLIVVTGADDAAVRQALAGIDVRFVPNPDAARGIGRSIAFGVAAVRDDAQAVLIALGDEPLVDRGVVGRVLDAHAATGAHIVAPRFAGVQGHPVLFDRAVFAELTALDGDRGARAVIERDPSRVHYLDFAQPAPPDVDTPDDLALAQARAQNRAPFTPS